MARKPKSTPTSKPKMKSAKSKSAKPPTFADRKRKAIKPRSKSKLPKSWSEWINTPEEFKTDYDNSLRVISKMRTRGLSLRQASKEIGVKPATVTKFNFPALRKRSNRSYKISYRDSMLRILVIPTSEGQREVAIRNSETATKISRYMRSVHDYLAANDLEGLTKFKGVVIKDVETGDQIELITDLSEIKRLAKAGVLSFESLYARG